MRNRLGWRGHFNSIESGFAKRPARSSKENTPDPTTLAACWQALKDGVVFAIDRQDRRPALTAGPQKDVAGHYQRFLVCEKNALAGACRGNR